MARVVWFSTLGTVLAARRYAGQRNTVTVCHNDALYGDVYVNHGLLIAAMRARGNHILRLMRNPLHLFTTARDSVRYRSSVHEAVVCLTRQESESLRRLHKRLRPRVHVIANGVDTARFSPPTTEQRTAARSLVSPDGPLPDDALCVLFIGHEFGRKGLPTAIGALREAPAQTHLLVVGGTPQMIAQAKRHCADSGVADRVHFTGALSDPILAYHASDALTLPSLYEANALVVLEALATGLPVVCTPVGYSSELVKPGYNGFLIDHDPAALAQAITQLSRMDLAGMARAARATAQAHSWEEIARRYLTVLAEVAPDARPEWERHLVSNGPDASGSGQAT